MREPNGGSYQDIPELQQLKSRSGSHNGEHIITIHDSDAESSANSVHNYGSAAMLDPNAHTIHNHGHITIHNHGSSVNNHNGGLTIHNYGSLNIHNHVAATTHNPGPAGTDYFHPPGTHHFNAATTHSGEGSSDRSSEYGKYGKFGKYGEHGKYSQGRPVAGGAPRAEAGSKPDKPDKAADKGAWANKVAGQAAIKTVVGIGVKGAIGWGPSLGDCLGALAHSCVQHITGHTKSE